MAVQIQIRRGTATEWTAANPVLAAGEQGYETDNRRMKIGDGVTAWTSLPYQDDEAAVAAPVQSVAGRTGEVTLTKADVGLSSVDNTSDASKPVSTATQAALNGKAASDHGHEQSDVSGLTTALANKSDTGHVHTSSNITDFGTAVDTRIQKIIGAAPAALDTLEELATAMGDDADFAATVTTALAGKEPNIAAGGPTQYWRGDKTWQTLDKTQVGLSSVDDTSDLSKPVSTATQAALNGKQAKSYVVVGTSLAGDGIGDYVCDGVADNVQLQAAIDYVLAAGGGVVHIKAGIYDIASSLTVTLGGKNLILQGEGYNTILSNSMNGASAAASTLNVQGAVDPAADYISIRDLLFRGSTVSGMGVRLTGCYQGDVTSCKFLDFKRGAGWGVGLWLNNSINIVMSNVVTKGCIYAGLQLGNASNANTILGGWFYFGGTSSAGMRVGSSNGNVFVGCIFESNDVAGAIVSSSARNNAFYNCWFEAQVDGLQVTSALQTIVDGCWFTLHTDQDVEVGAGAEDTMISRNRFNDGGNVTLASGAARVTISDNAKLTTVTDNGATAVAILNNHEFNPDVLHAQGNVTGAVTFNRANGSTITAILTGNITVTLAAGKAKGDSMTLMLSQDGTGGRTATWPSNFKKVGGALSLSTAPSAVDIISMQWNGSSWYEVSRGLSVI